jgi:hypothetical protein
MQTRQSEQWQGMCETRGASLTMRKSAQSCAAGVAQSVECVGAGYDNLGQPGDRTRLVGGAASRVNCGVERAQRAAGEEEQCARA